MSGLDEMTLDEAWAEVEAALPEGWKLMVGSTAGDCQFCEGWWATGSVRVPREEGFLKVVSSETGRPRGEHHDVTPAAALLELAAKLRAVS